MSNFLDYYEFPKLANAAYADLNPARSADIVGWQRVSTKRSDGKSEAPSTA